jgi:hypothetical protein
MAYDHRKHDTTIMLAMHIRSVNVLRPVDRCVLRDLYARLGDDPSLFLRLARLAAIFALKAGDVVERVERLALGPIRMARSTSHSQVFGGRSTTTGTRTASSSRASAR